MKYTPELAAEIFGIVEAGGSQRAAADLVGINETTISRWKKDHPEFADGIARADAEDEIWHGKNIRKHAKGDWRASAWHLARKRPELYSEKHIVEHAGEVNHAHTLNGELAAAFGRIAGLPDSERGELAGRKARQRPGNGNSEDPGGAPE